MKEGNECTFWSVDFLNQNFYLICYYFIVLHFCFNVASFFQEFYHFTLIIVILNRQYFIVFLLEIDFFFKMFSNFRIDSILKKSSESFTKIFLRIFILNTSKLFPSIIVNNQFYRKIVEGHCLFVPIPVINLILMHFSCYILDKKDNHYDGNGYI